MTAIELHHIHGGDMRSDEICNVISLCREHHARGTTHDLVHGPRSGYWNNLFLAIKLLKCETNVERLIEDGDDAEAITDLAEQIEESKPYIRGKRLGWYIN